MTDMQADGNATAAAIEAAFGDRWKVWLSDTGRWWAARNEPLTAAGLSAGCVAFLRASSPSELTRLISGQEQLQASASQQQTRSRPISQLHEGPATPSGESHE